MIKEQKKRILLVEDEKPIARALELKLTHANFLVRVATNGQEAITLFKKERFALILLDLILPIMNGFEVLQFLKENKNTIPVIVFSSLGQPEDQKRTKELGATDFIIKSTTSIADMVEKIKKSVA